MMNYGYYGHGYGWELSGMIGTVLFWALVVAGIVWLVRASRGHHYDGHHCGRGSNAIDILKERYAKGEIGKEEYDSKLADLSK
ncbi:MAG TPA: SHOCT domain-containing protein [Candidatus Paceibacterota bacterium]|nr:SHOCT domain-containing protein [Candidatus Paceibacterota bacterium]